MRGRVLVGISILWVPLAFLFDGVTVLILPLRVGGDATTLGLVSLVGLGIAAGLQPFAGWASDRLQGRIDRRLFIVAAAAPAIAGLWILVGSAGVAAVLLGYLLLQVAATAIQAGQQTLIPEHVDGPARGRASGLKTAFDVGGAFLAFLVIGLLLASGDVAAAALATSVVVVAGVALMLLLVPRAAASPRSGALLPLRIPAGFGRLVLARFLFLFATYAVGRFLVLLVAERLGIEPDRAADEAGGLLALFTVATAAAAIPLGWVADRWSRRDLMAGGAVIAGAGIVLLVPSVGLAGVVAGGLLMSVGTAAFVTANWAATTALVPREHAGRLMAIANLGTGLAAAAAGILGPLIDVSGFEPALLIAAGASAAAVIPLAGPGLRIACPTESPT